MRRRAFVKSGLVFTGLIWVPRAMSQSGLRSPAFVGQLKRPSGGAGYPSLPTSGLVENLDASTLSGSDGDLLSTWTASTGGNATSSGSNRPTLQTAEKNGLNVVRFDGVDDYMTTGATYLEGQPLCMLVVFKFNGTGDQFFLDSPTGLRVVLYKTSGNAWQAFAGTGFRTIGGTADNAWHILSIEWNGTSSKYRFDGGTETTFSADPGSNGSEGLILGIANDLASNPSNIDIAQVLVYSGAIADKSNHFGHLNGKWAVY